VSAAVEIGPAPRVLFAIACADSDWPAGRSRGKRGQARFFSATLTLLSDDEINSWLRAMVRLSTARLAMMDLTLSAIFAIPSALRVSAKVSGRLPESCNKVGVPFYFLFSFT
jgi:hypothetical protein